MASTTKPPQAARYLTPSTPCEPPPKATMMQAMRPMETPHTTFCQSAGSSSWRAPSVQSAAIVVDMVSAVVEKAAISVTMITGIRIAPNGTCFKNSQIPDTAPPSLIAAIISALPLICQLRAVLPHTENHTKPKDAGRIQLIIRNWRMVLP